MAEDSPKDQPPKKDPLANALEVALKREDVPKVYANGFSVGISNADIFIVFQRFGPNPVAVLNLSYTLAKTLAQRLGTMVAELENAIGQQNILTTDRIDAAFKKQQAEQAEGKRKTDSDDSIH